MSKTLSLSEKKKMFHVKHFFKGRGYTLSLYYLSLNPAKMDRLLDE